MSERPDYLQPIAGGVPTAVAPPPPASMRTAQPGITPPSGRGNSSAFITDVLVELGYSTREQIEQAITAARSAGRSPESLLLEHRMIDSTQLSRATAERYGLDHVDLNVFHVDMGAANQLSPGAARRYNAVPIGYFDESTLILAMADPANVIAIDDVQVITGLGCRVAVAAGEDINALIQRLSSLESVVSEAIDDVEEEGGALPDVSEMQESAGDAPVIKLVYSILGQGVNEGASDIHFEPGEGEMRVRFRVDGVLYEAAKVPRRMVAGVISRIKIMSELDIAEKRIPQDGRVGVTIEERKIDLRVTTLPTQRGEGATIRILDKESALRTLDELGMSGEPRKRFSDAAHRPYGAVLVTGPTGSGKSTSLYATLKELNSVEKKIITIEDPVEYRIDGINQINVAPRAGLTFAAGLRSILRADPDIIMVGEIRDGETARIAIEAALTGHLVLSTLHTNDAPGAISRLQKMGIESFLTASALDCVVAQRLARKLCENCRRPTVITGQSLLDAGFEPTGDIQGFEHVGCARCSGTGYKGRVGLYSVMKLSERIKELVIAGAGEAEITVVAREEGMMTLREDGLDKVRAGVTAVAEITRVTN
ncbi:type IV-A pilus assembly ATPase PilB [soil metagenome]